MVKILMVHGFGVNAAIFEAQTAPVRALLPSHWEYYFLQGPLECGPAPGIDKIYPGQSYNCWFHLPSLIEIQSVYDFLEEVIEEEGPFDVAWGFSAGATIIGSLLLRYAHETPHLPPPFRAAIFMNSQMPWSATEDLGKDVGPLAIRLQSIPPTEAEADRAIARELEKHKSKEDMLDDAARGAHWEDGGLIAPMMRHAYKNTHAQDLEKGVSHHKYSDYRAHRIFPEVDKVRVTVPTGHILAERDPLRELGEGMMKMCEPSLRLSFKHGFGHEIPPARSTRDLVKIKEVIEKTVMRSELVC
ncbi:MAG: hypothetical protein Q9201_005738 [Fulgogasparrea decipioides]